MKLFQSYLFIAFILLSISCAKDEDDSNNQTQPTLPQSSESYIYAQIDGEDLLIVHSDLFSETIGDFSTQGSGEFQINTIAVGGTFVTLAQSTNILVTLSINAPLDSIPLNTSMTYLQNINGEVEIVASVGGYGISIVGGDDIINSSSEELATNTVVVSITELDLINNIISGSFSFMAKDEETGNTYDISGGIFNKISF